jgi:PAS domain S-box-containing protein
VNATTRRDADSNIVGVVGVAQDVTEAAQHDRAVAAMARELRLLVDTANAPIFGIDVNGNVNEWNDKTSEITGFTKDEAFDKPLVSTFIVPSLRPSVQEVLDNALQGNETSNYELEFETKSKEIRGDWFRDYYILPFSGAIWSASLGQMLNFPAEALIRFFKNHNLLAASGHHQWYTVRGGSIEYVKLLEKDMLKRGVKIHTGSVVQGVRRTPAGVEIRTFSDEWKKFDSVVMASHSDQSLKMLENPSNEEAKLLSAIKYQKNQAYLHSDTIVMPKRKRCWSSWVYASDEIDNTNPVGVSYWMNRLQPISGNENFFQSLNPNREIKQELIYDQKTFMHPVFDREALSAQEKFNTIQGRNNTWYCGAWLRNGFHEDGYSSAVDILENIGMVSV